MKLIKNGKVVLYTLVTFFLLLIVFEFLGWVLTNYYDPNIEKTRQLLMGEKLLIHKQNSIAQPYLMYVSAPNFNKGGYQQHNEHGYRGELVPVPRRPKTVRILFMGGSTTYGFGVANPEDAYPAQVKKILEKTTELLETEIEVINAGLHYGTTAEILTHYAFKYRYYKPDIVVINTGGNDAMVYEFNNYQPDYSNWRKNITNVTPLKAYTRWMLHSRLVSFFVINLFFPDIARGGQIWHSGEHPYIKWFPNTTSSKIKINDNAFYNNLNTIVRDMLADSAKVILFPFQDNVDKTLPENMMFIPYYKENENIMRSIAKKYNIVFAPFPFEIIPKKCWIDDCHLNEEGCRIKADHIAKYIRQVIAAKNRIDVRDSTNVY